MWHYAKGKEQLGPIPSEELQGKVQSGELSGDTLVWKEGMTEWMPFAKVSSWLTSGNEEVSTSPPTVVYAPVHRNDYALTSMILGIVSIVLSSIILIGIVTAIPAVIFGHKARRQARESSVPLSGDGMAIAGLVLGYMVIVLTLVGLIALAAMFAFVAKEASP